MSTKANQSLHFVEIETEAIEALARRHRHRRPDEDNFSQFAITLSCGHLTCDVIAFKFV